MSSTCCADLPPRSARRFDQVGVERARRQHAGAAGGEAQQVGDARLVDREEGVEDGGHQDGAARVRLGDVAGTRAGRARAAATCRLSSSSPMALAQRAAQAGRVAELLASCAEQVLAGERMSPRVRGDLVAQHLGKREVLEQRHDVGEGLVEGEHVGVARLDEAAVHAVEQRVRGLVGDDVVRQAGEDHAAGQVLAGRVARRRGSSRTAAPSSPGCSRRWPRAARAGRCAGAARSASRSCGCVSLRRRPRRPQRLAAEGALEVVDGHHRDGVDHLLVELRVPSEGARPSCASRCGSSRSTGS